MNLATTTDATDALLLELVAAINAGQLQANCSAGGALLRRVRAHVAQVNDRSAARANPVRLSGEFERQVAVVLHEEARTVLRGPPPVRNRAPAVDAEAPTIDGGGHYDEVDMTPTFEPNTIVANTERIK